MVSVQFSVGIPNCKSVNYETEKSGALLICGRNGSNFL